MMDAFGFFAPTFLEVVRTYKCYFVILWTAGWVVGTIRGGGDTHTLPALIEKKNQLALTNSEDAKTSHLYTLMPLISGCAHAPEPPGETFTAFLVAC